MAQIQEFSTSGDSNVAAVDPKVFYCKDCKTPVPIESLIDVDPLHVQCPNCLYVFFYDAAAKNR